MFDKLSPRAGHVLYKNLNDRGTASCIFVATPTATQLGNSAQNYIKFNTGLVNNFNNFSNICNILHICMEKNATVSVGSRFKVIILIIIFY